MSNYLLIMHEYIIIHACFFKRWKVPMITCGFLYGLLKEKFLLSFCWNPSWLINLVVPLVIMTSFGWSFNLCSLFLIFYTSLAICFGSKNHFEFLSFEPFFSHLYIPHIFFTCFSGRWLVHFILFFGSFGHKQINKLVFTNSTPRWVIGFFWLLHVFFIFWSPDLKCWFTNHRWCQLLSQRSVGTLASNQLLPNASLERDRKAPIDLVDGLSSRSVVLVSVTDGDLVDHDARLRGGAAERLLGHDDQAQAITVTLLVVIGMCLGGSDLGSD